MKLRLLVELANPILQAWNVVALEAKQDVLPSSPLIGSIGHERLIGGKLFRGHTHVGGVSSRQRRVTGNDNPPQSALFCHGSVVARVAAGVFAERRVHVGFVEEAV